MQRDQWPPLILMCIFSCAAAALSTYAFYKMAIVTNIVLDTVVTMFSEYCTPAKFSVEPVDVVYASATAGVKAIETTPQLSQRT